MQNLIYISIGVVILYIVYRIMGVWLLPKIADHHLKKYKQDFFTKNPQIDKDKFNAHMKEEEDKTIIIEHRKKYK